MIKTAAGLYNWMFNSGKLITPETLVEFQKFLGQQQDWKISFKDNSIVSWWKNPGNGKGNWVRFEVGSGTGPDRYVVEDLNGEAVRVPSQSTFSYSALRDLSSRLRRRIREFTK